MKRVRIISLCVLGIIIIGFAVGSYNSMISKDQSIKTQWAQVENQYQRRYDLVPNLVATVKAYATHETEVFTNIANARSNAYGTNSVSDDIINNSESFERYQKVQNELGSALQRLLVITENYPELKSDQNFLALQDQLEGTENRISVERKRYNDLVGSYNTYIKMFPRSIIAKLNGFSEKEFFASNNGAQEAPKVSF